jgi:hypothetical protein
VDADQTCSVADHSADIYSHGDRYNASPGCCAERDPGGADFDAHQADADGDAITAHIYAYADRPIVSTCIPSARPHVADQ